MLFQTQLRYARITYAVIMASTTCIVMSAMTTIILTPGHFWSHWPRVLGIDLLVANPIAIILGPFVRRLCLRIYPKIAK